MLNVMERRRACRNFDPRPVEQEKIEEIVQAGLLAPSGMGRQTSIVIAISDKITRDKLAALNASVMGYDGVDPFYGAPVVLLVIAKKSPLAIHDGAATIENMLLEATEQGLGSCWIHRADEEIQSSIGREILSFTGLNFDEYVGVGHVVVGYSNVKNYPEKIIRKERVFYK